VQPKPNQTQYEKLRPKPNQTAIFRHNPNPNPNPTLPKTKHLNISKHKIFSNWGKIMLLLFLTLSFEKFWFLFDLKKFLYSIFIFFKKFEKKFQKKVAKFLKNGFLVLSEQIRTKLKDCRKNQNQTITKCFSKFETKPNPNPTQTEPNPKELESVATLIYSYQWLMYR
jgi:hypothetical protein